MVKILVKLAHLTGLQAPVKFGAYRFLLNRALNHAVRLTNVGAFDPYSENSNRKTCSYS